MKFLICFCFLFLHISQLLAQKINVKINIFTEDKTPLPFTTIYLPELERGNITDSLGVGVLKDIPIGTYLLEISSMGYYKYKKEIMINPTNFSFDVYLKSKTDILDEIVVTGTLREVRKSESIVPVELYDVKFFQRNFTPSIFEGMVNVNGVRPQLQCNVCNTGDIHINGMEGPYTMVLIDNMPIVSGLSTVYGLSGIPNSILSRVEIIKGPASSIYGSEAMGGIINIITKDPEKAPLFSFDTNITSYKETSTDVSTKFNLGKKISTLLAVNYFYFNERFDINKDNFTDITLVKRVSIFNKWKFTRKNDRRASLAFRYLYEDRFGGEMEWRENFRGTDIIYGESIYTNRYEFIGAYQLPIENEEIIFNFSANTHLQDSYYGNLQYKAHQNIFFNQLNWYKKINEIYHFTLGISYKFTYYDDNTPVTHNENTNTNDPNLISITGVFLQNELNLMKKTRLLLGLRYDYNSIHKNIFSPRIGLKYKINNFNTLRFNMGNGFRIVNVFSEDHMALVGGRKVVFLEKIQPEKSWNGNLNYSLFIDIPSGFINIDYSVFYTYYDNKIVADYMKNAEQIIYKNLDSFAENYGTSLSIELSLHPFQFHLATTYLQSYIYEDGQKIHTIQTPNFTMNYSFSYSIEKINLTINLQGLMNSSMLLPVFPNDYRPDSSPFFNITNLQFNKKWGKGFETYVGIKNVFNFFPQEDVIMRPFDPFDKKIDQNNPNNYTFDPSYNYAPIKNTQFLIGINFAIK